MPAGCWRVLKLPSADAAEDAERHYLRLHNYTANTKGNDKARQLTVQFDGQLRPLHIVVAKLRRLAQSAAAPTAVAVWTLCGS